MLFFALSSIPLTTHKNKKIRNLPTISILLCPMPYRAILQFLWGRLWGRNSPYRRHNAKY